MEKTKTHGPISYEIKIHEILQDKWMHWLKDATIHIIDFDVNEAYTTISITVPDQAALRGILNKLWDLNSTLVSVNKKVQ
jgi:predicted RNA binding protein with dsRBD fold (UPF0201 family)